MSWLKISDKDGGVYAKEPDNDPEQIVSVAEIEAEIKELQARIDSIHLIEITKEMSEAVLSLVNAENAKTQVTIVGLRDAILGKRELITELNGL